MKASKCQNRFHVWVALLAFWVKTTTHTIPFQQENKKVRGWEGDYCREFTVSERKSLTTTLRALHYSLIFRVESVIQLCSSVDVAVGTIKSCPS